MFDSYCDTKIQMRVLSEQATVNSPFKCFLAEVFIVAVALVGIFAQATLWATLINWEL